MTVQSIGKSNWVERVEDDGQSKFAPALFHASVGLLHVARALVSGSRPCHVNATWPWHGDRAPVGLRDVAGALEVRAARREGLLGRRARRRRRSRLVSTARGAARSDEDDARSERGTLPASAATGAGP